MPQASTNDSFKRSRALVNTEGIDTADGQTIGVECLTTDPVLTAGEPRIWINLTSGTLKFTHNGSTVKTVTAS